jgi:phosphoenolpyruvate synthase/pyruvate phosphate dikinase
MASDDWRLRIQLQEGSAAELLDRIGLELGSEAAELAKDLEQRRLAVSRDGDTIFVYAGTRTEIEKGKQIVDAEIRRHELHAHESAIEHWLHEEERWDDEPPRPDVEEEILEEGYAPWEVRVECDSHEEARELADKLEAEGYGLARRFHHVIVGTSTEEEARELAKRLHGDVEAGGELVYETMPQNPFAVFGGLGG